jgi:Flp pilus assembly protein TadG
MRHLRQPARRAATLVEFAVVAPITFLLLIGLLVGGMGIFRYQEVAALARDASRYASVHGSQYATDTGNAAAAPDDGQWSGGTGQCSLVYNNVIASEAVALDMKKLTYAVTWNSSNAQFHTATVNGQTVNVANTVTVTVTYRWIPEAYLKGITLSSTSVCVMSY